MGVGDGSGEGERACIWGGEDGATLGFGESSFDSAPSTLALGDFFLV